jgi:hypothetical protein
MPEPKLSFVLATDTYQTIRPVIDRLRRQTARDQIELILVAATFEDASPVIAHRSEFAALKIVEHPVNDLAPARAAGIRAATARFVFVGETHSYPHPGLVEALLRHYSSPWSVIVPAFGNANPNGALSWAGFLADYGGWPEGMPEGEVSRTPFYNAAFLREALRSLDGRLEHALSHGDELSIALRDGGHKAYFEPAARLDHVNVAKGWDFVKERFAAGVMIASSRARRWSVSRRALYALASPLIPFVLCWRVLPGVWRTVRQKRLPISILFWVLIGTVVKVAGEFMVYVGASVKGWEPVMHEYEVHKLAYAARGTART